MKRMTLLMVLGLLCLGLVPGGVNAQLICVEPNIYAITFDTEASLINLTGVAPYGQYQAYLYMINPDPACALGFEVEVIFPEQSTLLTTTLPDGAFNAGEGGNFIVGFGYPRVPVTNHLLLATFSLMNMVSSDQVQEFFLSPATPASIEGSMAYLNCSESIIATTPVSGDFSLPVARVNGTQVLNYCEDLEIDGITVQISSQGDADNLAGTAFYASDGYDLAFDLVDPEVEPVVFFFHPEWQEPVGNLFKQDIMELFDPYSETKVWHFRVNSEFPSGESAPYGIDLDFVPSFAGDESIFLSLVDMTTGEISVVEEPYGHSFEIYQSEVREFQMVIGFEAVHLPVPALDVQIDVSCNGFSDNGNHASAADWATDGYDEGVDIPEPGPPPGNYLTASFTNTGWPLGPRFRSMVHAEYSPDGDIKTWPLRIETDQVGTVEINFIPSFYEADMISLMVKDQQNGQIYDLFPGLTFTFENQVPSIRNFLVIVGNQGPPALEPVEKILAPGWAMAGLPLRPEFETSSLQDIMLSQVSGPGYIYHYLTDEGYVQNDPGSPAIFGRGYWLAVNEHSSWSMEGEKALEPVTLPLNNGWNLIGYPLWFEGAKENILVQYDNKTYSWDLAVAEGIVLGSVLGYNRISDQYDMVDDLESWTGYWFGALQEGVSLVFNWELFLELPERITNPDRQVHPPESIWTTKVKATDALGNAHQVSFGVHPDASEGFDPELDIPLAPPGPSSVGHFGILRPEWELSLGNKVYRDLVSPTENTKVWSTEIVSSGTGPVTLIWDRLNWPQDLDLQIYIPSENRVVMQSMRSQNSIRLSSPSGYLVVQFRTPDISGVEDVPAATNQLGIHPNPFNPQTTISFELSQKGKVEIRIYSVRGELVSTLPADAAAPGRHQVTWMGRDRAGREVPSGSYFARLYVDGQARGPVAKMSLIR